MSEERNKEMIQILRYEFKDIFNIGSFKIFYSEFLNIMTQTSVRTPGFIIRNWSVPEVALLPL